MPLKLNVGVSKKVGLPEYSSVGASCNLEVELSQEMLQGDVAAFHERVRSAYIACHQAVHDELTRLQGRPAAPARPVENPNGRAARNGVHAAPEPNAPVPAGRRALRPATPSQVRAIRAIAQRNHADLGGVLNDDFGVDRPEGLSVAQASELIERLREAAGV